MTVSPFALAADSLDPPLTDEPNARHLALMPHQMAPAGDWIYWMLYGGRGIGKTGGGAHWLNQHVLGPPCDENLPGGHRPAIIAPTLGDAVESCIEGPVGLRVQNPAIKLVTSRGGTHVVWPNGSKAKLFGTYTKEDLERLRAGGNRCAVWCEEFAAWRYLDKAWPHIELGLRLGPKPRGVMTTTPKNKPLFKKLLKADHVALTHARTEDNPHLPEERKRILYDQYQGTRLGQQELEGLVVEDVEGALWNQALIEKVRVPESEREALYSRMNRILVAVDPSTGSGRHDECGIVVVARGNDRLGYVLEDASTRGTPEHWAERAAERYHYWKADGVLVETNFHAELVRLVMKTVDPSVHIIERNTSRGKKIRAEPVLALYEKTPPRVLHLGHFPRLEEQMTTWIPPGSEPEGEDPSDFSPDRMDALVWGLTEVVLKYGGPATVHSAAGQRLPSPRR